MIQVASSFQTTAAITTVPVLIPGRQLLIGVQLCMAGAGDVASSFIQLQASSSGSYQQSSGVGNAPMYSVFAQLTGYSLLNAGLTREIFVPQNLIPVSDRIYLHAWVGSGQTTFFTGVFLFE